MKQKILEALKQGYKNLGMSEEAFERVAAFGETFIKEEGDIANFVKGAEAILKAEQSAVDKVRSEYAAKLKTLETEKAELEAKLKDGNEPPKREETKPEQPDIAKLVSEAVTAAVKPLSDELAQVKGKEATKLAVKTAKDKFFANEYAAKYTQERDDAWERAIERFEDKGSTMNADELHDMTMGYFNKLVARKGVTDTSKPLDSEGSGQTHDFGGMAQRLAERGKIVTETKD